jgi:indolepyruvate ferredoxin oxidoreductase beta subunit
MKKSDKKVKEFNVVITGIGGQGVLTLGAILSEAALKCGHDVKMSELHGLAQRGGSVPCQVRFGEKIYSSLIKAGHADLIIALEPLEALRSAKLASKGRTTFIINSRKVEPVSVTILGDKYPTMQQLKKELGEFAKEVIVVDASAKAIELTGTEVTSNIYMLGLASAKGIIPIEKDVLLEAIKGIVPEKYFEMNKKIFEAAEQ